MSQEKLWHQRDNSQGRCHKPGWGINLLLNMLSRFPNAHIEMTDAHNDDTPFYVLHFGREGLHDIVYVIDLTNEEKFVQSVYHVWRDGHCDGV